MTARIICLPPPAGWISIGDASARVAERLLRIRLQQVQR
jgi:predicted nuclease of predicted toxin-antitoxin system